MVSVALQEGCGFCSSPQAFQPDVHWAELERGDEQAALKRADSEALQCRMLATVYRCSALENGAFPSASLPDEPVQNYPERILGLILYVCRCRYEQTFFEPARHVHRESRKSFFSLRCANKFCCHERKIFYRMSFRVYHHGGVNCLLWIIYQ